MEGEIVAGRVDLVPRGKRRGHRFPEGYRIRLTVQPDSLKETFYHGEKQF